jgi:hypothetical protein
MAVPVVAGTTGAPDDDEIEPTPPPANTVPAGLSIPRLIQHQADGGRSAGAEQVDERVAARRRHRRDHEHAFNDVSPGLKREPPVRRRGENGLRAGVARERSCGVGADDVAHCDHTAIAGVGRRVEAISVEL